MGFNKIQTLLNAFRKQVNILIIDDDVQIGNTLIEDVFLSPMLNLIQVKTIKEALQLINNFKGRWHCWIVDVNLKEQQDGSTLLDLYPNFDYAIIFSGVKTLEVASNALKKGAISAFSKDPAFLYDSDAFYNEVCKVSALSYILKGAHNEHQTVFNPLFSNTIVTIEDWATEAHLSLRQLQRVCELYVPFAPRMLLPLYHSLYIGLRDPAFTENFETPTPEDIRIKNNHDFYTNCIELVVNKLDTVYKSHYNDL